MKSCARSHVMSMSASSPRGASLEAKTYWPTVMPDRYRSKRWRVLLPGFFGFSLTRTRITESGLPCHRRRISAFDFRIATHYSSAPPSRWNSTSKAKRWPCELSHSLLTLRIGFGIAVCENPQLGMPIGQCQA
jgi:hypothetical protein